jgi:outer membrane protein
MFHTQRRSHCILGLHRTSWRGLARQFGMVGTAGGALLSLTLLGPAHAQTLEDALAQAYHSNPTLLAQRAQVRAVDEQVPQALSNWRPTVTFTAEAGKSLVETEAKNNSVATTLRNTENRTPRTLELAVSQPLFRGFRTVAETERAESLVLAERARLGVIEQTVLRNAVTAFLDVVREQAVLELTVGNEQVLERQLEAAQDRFEVGEVTRTDVSQAEARLAGATAERILAAGTLESARATYQRVIGEMPGTLLAPQAPEDALPMSLDEAIEMARESNPAVVAASYHEKAANDNVDLIEGELLPTLSLDGDLSRTQDVSGRASEIDSVSVTATLTVPIYQSGSVFSRVREAKQLASRRRVEIDEAMRDAVQLAITAWEELTTARARVVSFQKEADSNTIALEGTQQEATAGLRTVLDILDAEQELLNSRVDLVRARRDVVVGSYRLLEAVGGLTARYLNLPVAYYDPTVYYDEVRDKFFGLGDDIE